MARNRELKKEEIFRLQIEAEQALIAKDAARDAKSKSDQLSHQRSSLAFANLQRLQKKQDEGDAKRMMDNATLDNSNDQKEGGSKTQLLLSRPQASALTHETLRGLGSTELAA